MNRNSQTKSCLYVFLDEAGNFDFSPNGTRYLVFSALSVQRPLPLCEPLACLKFDLIEESHPVEYFHASEDAQHVRDRVFGIIGGHLPNMRLDSLVVEKRKTMPTLRPVTQFYPRMFGYLLGYVLRGHDLTQFSKVIVYTDAIPVKKIRKAVEKATKTQLSHMLPADARYVLVHHASMSNPYLQVVDYMNWAIYRKWDRGDVRSYGLIAEAVVSEFDIFRQGTRRFY